MSAKPSGFLNITKANLNPHERNKTEIIPQLNKEESNFPNNTLSKSSHRRCSSK